MKQKKSKGAQVVLAPYEERLEEEISDFLFQDHVVRVYHLPEYHEGTITLVYVEKGGNLLPYDGGVTVLTPYYGCDVVVVNINEEEEKSLLSKDDEVFIDNEVLYDVDKWVRLGSHQGLLIAYDTKEVE
jgi:hypothetical protein